MGFLAKILSIFKDEDNIQNVKAETFSGDNVTAFVFGNNENFSPTVGSKAVVTPLAGNNGLMVMLSSINENIENTTSPGEKQIFSTDSNGEEIKADITLKNDGTISIKNDSISIELDSSGKATIKGDVCIEGQLDVTGVISSDIEVTAASVNLTTHTHNYTDDGVILITNPPNPV